MALEAYNERQEFETQRLAWHAANIMQPWCKKKIRPSDLLGKPREDKAVFTTKAQVLDYVKAKRERLAKHGDRGR